MFSKKYYWLKNNKEAKLEGFPSLIDCKLCDKNKNPVTCENFSYTYEYEINNTQYKLIIDGSMKDGQIIKGTLITNFVKRVGTWNNWNLVEGEAYKKDEKDWKLMESGKFKDDHVCDGMLFEDYSKRWLFGTFVNKLLEGEGIIYEDEEKKKIYAKGIFKKGELLEGMVVYSRHYCFGKFENFKLTGEGEIYEDEDKKKLVQKGIFKDNKLIDGIFIGKNYTVGKWNSDGNLDGECEVYNIERTVLHRKGLFENGYFKKGLMFWENKYYVGNFKKNTLNGNGSVYEDLDQIKPLQRGFFVDDKLKHGIEYSPPTFVFDFIKSPIERLPVLVGQYKDVPFYVINNLYGSRYDIIVNGKFLTTFDLSPLQADEKMDRETEYFLILLRYFIQNPSEWQIINQASIDDVKTIEEKWNISNCISVSSLCVTDPLELFIRQYFIQKHQLQHEAPSKDVHNVNEENKTSIETKNNNDVETPINPPLPPPPPYANEFGGYCNFLPFSTFATIPSTLWKTFESLFED